MKNIKKIIASTICVFTFCLLYAATPGIGNKVSELKTEGYRIFQGFNFEDLSSESHKESLEERINSEINYVIEDDIEKNYTGPYAIVGHSQGGLRVLAYASMLESRINDPNLSEEERVKAKGSFQRLSGVITMSGIDRGLKALENNFDTFRVKLLEDGNIWLDGINGLCRVSLILTAFENWALKALEISDANDIVYKVADWFPDFASSYILAGWDRQPYSEIPEVYDMVPGSDFIEKNVSKTTSVTYKRQTGTRTYRSWERKGLFWWWVKHEEPVYTTYTVYKDNPEFSKTLPIGYVVGTDSNTLGLLDDKEDEVRNICETVSKVMDVGQVANHVMCYATLGIGFLTGHYTAYKDCCSARDWLKNVDGELNELKGSEENDGLVAKESQFYPKQFYNPITQEYEEVHTKVLGRNEKGYVEVCKNHKDIYCQETFDDVIIPMIYQINE